MLYYGYCKGMKVLNPPGLVEVEVYQAQMAEYYDDMAKNNYEANIFSGIANVFGNKILELGCGSGRITLPLVKKGFDVTGIDLSKDMINLCKEKCTNMSKKPNLFCADMFNYLENERFDVVIFPATTISLIKTHDERVKLFKNVYKNLRKGGVFLFNYENIDFSKLIMNEIKSRYFFNKSKNSYIILFEKTHKDKTKKIINYYIEEIRIDGRPKRYISAYNYYLLNNQLVNDIIKETNFTFIDNKPFNDKEVLCIIKKP